MQGRQHANLQAGNLLERLTDEELAACGATQTEQSGPPPPPLPSRVVAANAASGGQDAGTQLTDTELPSFDVEVWLSFLLLLRRVGHFSCMSTPSQIWQLALRSRGGKNCDLGINAHTDLYQGHAFLSMTNVS